MYTILLNEKGNSVNDEEYQPIKLAYSTVQIPNICFAIF